MRTRASPKYFVTDCRLYSWRNFAIEFYFFILLLHRFPWINIYFLTGNKFLPRLIKKVSLHCIFQRMFVLNTRSIKAHRRNSIKILITLLLKN